MLVAEQPFNSGRFGAPKLPDHWKSHVLKTTQSKSTRCVIDIQIQLELQLDHMVTYGGGTCLQHDQ
jgi:hypothetical protein